MIFVYWMEKYQEILYDKILTIDPPLASGFQLLSGSFLIRFSLNHTGKTNHYIKISYEVSQQGSYEDIKP